MKRLVNGRDKRGKGIQRATVCSLGGVKGHRADNKKFHPEGLRRASKQPLPKYSPPYFDEPAAATKGLLDLRQIDFEGFLQKHCKTEAAAMRTLVRGKWLPSLSLKRHCWKCSGVLTRKGYTLRCTKKHCRVQFQDGRIPYSPLHCGARHARRSARHFLKVAYLFSLGLPKDAATIIAGLL